MPPKKGKKGKKKKAPKDDPNALTEVDKTFYELTITDLNRKLARLRSLTTELEERNEQLETDLSKLDEDRNDIISYLKRILQEKSDEISELQERLKALEETRQEETENYEQKITDLENEYKQMHEQLTSEIKLLEGKLNSLEEFRIQRDELMKKFEDQEIQMEEQEKRHKNELYEIERKFIIGKDKLKKDMEARLLQLSSEFQEATELRIAATTHRVIRENIAINNELDAMLLTHDRLHKENAEMKEKDRTYRQEAELHEAEKNKALAKVGIQRKIIDRLTTQHEELTKKLNKYQTVEKEMHEASKELHKTKQSVLCMEHKIRVLEQNVHALKCKELSLQTDLNNVTADNDRLTVTLGQAVAAIKDVLEVSAEVDEALITSKRESLVQQIFTLLSEAETKKARRPSLETIGSLSATYQRGDLGFVPKPATSRRSSIPTVRHIEVQMGPSFEEFLSVHKDEDLEDGISTSIVSSEEQGEGSEEVVSEEQSDVFFDEEEDQVEDSLEDLPDIEFDDDDVPKRQASKMSKESVVSGEKKTKVEKEKSAVSLEEGHTKSKISKISVKSDKEPRQSSRGSILKRESSRVSQTRVSIKSDKELELEKANIELSREKLEEKSAAKISFDAGSKSALTKRSGSIVEEEQRRSKESVGVTEEGETSAETSPLPEDVPTE